MKKLLSIDEVSELLNIKKSTIYAWVHHKKIPFVKMGNKLKFIEDQLLEYIAIHNFKPDF